MSFNMNIIISVLFASLLFFVQTDADHIVKFKSCDQSSVFRPDFTCEWAMDGQHSNKICTTQFSHTRKTMKAWWSGTLEKETKISKVEIVGRTHSLIYKRLKNFNVILDGGVVCAKYTAPTPVHDVTLPCVGVSKTVKIQLRGANFLTLCEVSVYEKDVKKTEICPIGYWHDQSKLKCYSKPSDKRMTYFDAKKWCSNKGGILPELPTNEEIANFNSFVPNTTNEDWLSGFWLGALRRGRNFYWERNGSKVAAYGYAPGEPNNYKGIEDRLQVAKNPNTMKYYNKFLDLPKHWKKNAICQSH